ncbi:MAG TPA: NlpC/P60 family protein, partial [Roseiflexaceae bacterium]|nr:NlpC/P60 family protein [Roseiflexaceae bacterium]
MRALARGIILVGIAPVVALLLACGMPVGISQGPRWACPSPVPQPFGPDGPPKSERRVCQVDPVTGQQVCHTEYEYYEIWEQEYGPGGSLLAGQPAVQNGPFPSPTPYGRQGNTYTFGQRVELAPLHVVVTARNGALYGNRQAYLVTLEWSNPTGRPIPISYQRQVWLRSITRADGTLLTGDGWNVDPRFASEQGVKLTDAIAPGESAITFPILAPPGMAKTVELRMPVVAPDGNSGDQQTPTPNAELRARHEREITVQWLDAQPVGPACDDPGARTDWSQDDPKAIPRDAQVQLASPGGANRVVQLVLAQVGKRYVWGAAGPDVFDCSGLMYWAYDQIGITIPRTTAT